MKKSTLKLTFYEIKEFLKLPDDNDDLYITATDMWNHPNKKYISRYTERPYKNFCYPDHYIIIKEILSFIPKKNRKIFLSMLERGLSELVNLFCSQKEKSFSSPTFLYDDEDEKWKKLVENSND